MDPIKNIDRVPNSLMSSAHVQKLPHCNFLISVLHDLMTFDNVRYPQACVLILSKSAALPISLTRF